MQADFRNAIYYQQKSLDLAKATNDKAGIAHTSLSMGLTYNNLGDTARARCFLLDAVEPARSEKLNNVELYAYSNLADLFNNKTDKNKAYDFAMKAANPGAKMGDQGIQPTQPARVPGWDYLLVKM